MNSITHKSNLSNMNKHKNLLSILASAKPNLRESIIHKCDKQLVQCICECILNLLHGNININRETLCKLKKYKNTFRKIIKKSNLQSKKKILIQQGGFLQYLIPAVISGLSSIISSAINRKEEEE